MNKQERTALARRHHEDMLMKYPVEITECVHQTTVYGAPDRIPAKIMRPGQPKHFVTDNDVVTEIYAHSMADIHLCVLNFADYVLPGGRYIQGSGAQEESLCSESILYEVLASEPLAYYYAYNSKHKHSGIYEDRALFTPNVLFFRSGGGLRVSVLSCAAPSRRGSLRNASLPAEKNLEALRSRIRFIAEILEEKQVDIFLCGAWGCGVFGQDPETVAEMFLNNTWGEHPQWIIHPVIGEKNNTAFHRILPE